MTNDVGWRTMQNGTDKGVFHVYLRGRCLFLCLTDENDGKFDDTEELYYVFDYGILRQQR